MNKFNVYYYGEDTSHCSSCRERDDERIVVLITSLPIDEMKIKLEEYCNYSDGFTYASFLERISCNGSYGDNLIYPTIFFEQNGTSYPDFYLSSFIDKTYNVEEVLDPSKVLPDWKRIQEKWKMKEIENRKKQAEKLAEEEREKIERKKIKDNQKEYDLYVSLKKDWEGKKSPDSYVPTKKDLKNVEKFLEEFKEKKKQFTKYQKLKGTWEGKERPLDYPEKELTGFAKFLKEFKEKQNGK